MTQRINGAAIGQQSLSGSLQYYVVYAASDNAVSDPNANPPPAEELIRGVNILTTGDITDQSQKNFEILLQSIGLRATPIIMNDPEPVADLSAEGATSLTGEGYIYKFAVERTFAFENFGPGGTVSDVGLLVDELDGVVLPSGVRITTVDGSPSGFAKNIEFERKDEL